MSTRPIIRLTQAEYLQLDRQSELRHELSAKSNIIAVRLTIAGY